jgi:hypothetical protein
VNNKVDGHKTETGKASRGKKRKEKGKSYGGIIRGVKLGIKEKRKGKGEDEGCTERKFHIGNK